ncbi:hypothetical protein ACFLT9_01960 [Acidobacteriota bacterium]
MTIRSRNGPLGALYIILFMISLSLYGQEVRLQVVSVESEGQDLLIKGRISASGLNAMGVPESDTVKIIVDIKNGPDSVYPLLQDAVGHTPPDGAETNLIKDNRFMTKEEFLGSDIERLELVKIELRPASVWENHGGMDEWENSAPDRVEKEFDCRIPQSHEGKVVRIRAELIHVWGGPHVWQPGINFFHDVGFEGELKPGVSSESQRVQPQDKIEAKRLADVTDVEEKREGERELKVNLSYTPMNPRMGDPVRIRAAISPTSLAGLTFDWIVDDHLYGNDPMEISLSSLISGSHKVEVFISDGRGKTAKDSISFSVEEPEEVKVEPPDRVVPQKKPASVPCPKQPAGSYVVRASLDTDCMLKEGWICVDEGQEALAFQSNLYSSWAPCSGNRIVEEIGYSIERRDDNRTVYTFTQQINLKTSEIGGTISSLRLGPGAYKITVRGAQSTHLSLQFQLK